MTGGPEPLSWPVTRHEILSRPLTLWPRATKNAVGRIPAHGKHTQQDARNAQVTRSSSCFALPSISSLAS